MRLVLLSIILLIVAGCVNYNQLHFTPQELFPNKRFEKNIDRYNIIVHDEERVAVLKEPSVDQYGIKGKLTYIDKDSVVEKPLTKEAQKEHRADVHIYLDGKQEFELPEFKNGKKDVTIEVENMDEITAFSSNEKDIIGKIFLIIGAVVLVFAMLIALMALIFTAFILAFQSNDPNNPNSGTSNSGGSGSNSNSGGSGGGGSNSGGSGGNGSNSGGSNSGGSNSGGSNSGGSNSGGSNSGGSGGSNSGGSNSSSSNSGGGGSGSGGSNSGCYVATMAYGDYEDPHVLTLRRYRDEVLLKTKRGRQFVVFYYAYSPRFVHKTRNWTWLHRILRLYLNQLVLCLRKRKNIR